MTRRIGTAVDKGIGGYGVKFEIPSWCVKCKSRRSWLKEAHTRIHLCALSNITVTVFWELKKVKYDSIFEGRDEQEYWEAQIRKENMDISN